MVFDGNIIWSADGFTDKQLHKLFSHDKFPRERVAAKLDRAFWEETPSKWFIDEVQTGCGVAVFCDTKIVEIPSKSRIIGGVYLEHCPWMLNIMCNTCNNLRTLDDIDRDEIDGDINKLDFVAQFAYDCKQAGTLSCGVTVLTSKTKATAKFEHGVTAEEMVRKYAEHMVKCGMTDIVCSAQEASFIKDLEIKINTPGIRLLGNSNDDQSRVMTPGKAFANGADRIIVGRSLYSGDPDSLSVEVFNDNLNRILEDIATYKEVS